MPNHALQALVDDVSRDGKVSSDEALALRKSVFTDGVISRDEADALVSLERRVANSDNAWAQAFAEAVVDHVLGCGVHPGHVDDASAQWLMASFADATRAETCVEALLKVLERADSAPEALAEFVRARVAASVAGKAMDKAKVEMVRRALYASAGSGTVAVTDGEVRWLFALDAESDGRANDASWQDLFVKASLCHVMGRSAPKHLEADALQAREARTSVPAEVSAKSILSRFTEGGLQGFVTKLREPGYYEGVENRYAEANAAAEADAVLTPDEVAKMLGMSDDDGKRTTNERALLAALNA
jgi:hypothetical protein